MRFLIVNQQLEQYYNYYNSRLMTVRESLIAKSKEKWGSDTKNVPLGDLNDILGQESVFILGTLFKVMPNQPSVLKELDSEHHNMSRFDLSCTQTNYTSDEDKIVLHEIEENVTLKGDINPHEHVTGIPVSLLGYQVDNGTYFHVTDICYNGPTLNVYRPLSEDRQKSGSRQILLVSGLEFGIDSAPNFDSESWESIVKSLKALTEFVCDGSTDQENGSSVVQVIIAGNSVASGIARTLDKSYQSKPGANNTNHGDENKIKHVERPSLPTIMKVLDEFIYRLAHSTDVDVMPGNYDPSTFLFPQQPFHPKILPKSSSLTSVKHVTNPHVAEYEGRLFAGTSGQPVDAIRQYSRIEFSTTILKHTLEWGHLAPSAPDNLSCVPFHDRDPFVIDAIPEVYFAGNQPEYAVTTYSCESRPKIQFVSIPKFSKTRSCVLVDLDTLECELMQF